MDVQSVGRRRGDGMLFPGLFDEVTVEHIATRVSWRTLCVLACVNWAWKRAIEGRQVYNARKRTQSDQTLLVSASKCGNGEFKLVVHDLEQQLMPLVPHLRSVMPEFVEKSLALPVLLDDKVYVWDHYLHKTEGGDYQSQMRFLSLDLGGCHRTWKPCSGAEFTAFTEYFDSWNEKLELRRIWDGKLELCVPCDGKLYAFSQEFLSVEVFDPKKDEWSLIVVDEPCIAPGRIVSLIGGWPVSIRKSTFRYRITESAS